jgi:hypothetical protein
MDGTAASRCAPPCFAEPQLLTWYGREAQGDARGCRHEWVGKACE